MKGRPRAALRSGYQLGLRRGASGRLSERRAGGACASPPRWLGDSPSGLGDAPLRAGTSTARTGNLHLPDHLLSAVARTVAIRSRRTRGKRRKSRSYHDASPAPRSGRGREGVSLLGKPLRIVVLVATAFAAVAVAAAGHARATDNCRPARVVVYASTDW